MSTVTRYDALVRPDRIGAALAEVTGDPRWRRLRVELVSGGKSNLTFQLTSDAGELVLRRPPSGQLLPKAHDMGRETRIQRALAGTAVPVPEIVMADLDGELLGVPCYVMRKVTGHVLRDELPPGYATTEVDKVAIANALIDVLVELHRIDPYAIGLAAHGRPEGFYARQVRRWSEQWHRSKIQDVPAIDELMKRLARRTPATGRASIVHGDYRLDNCLMGTNDPGRVVAVLDWELSTLGDPLADVGMLLFYWTQAGEPTPALTPALTATPGFPPRRHLLERYLASTGADHTDLLTYQAYAHFKFAVIAQGVGVRAAAGELAGQNFGDLSAEVVRIAEDGLALLDE